MYKNIMSFIYLKTILNKYQIINKYSSITTLGHSKFFSRRCETGVENKQDSERTAHHSARNSMVVELTPMIHRQLWVAMDSYQ
jgi:hypothetical protein